MKKIVIAAGTGFLGNVLVDHFKNKAEEIVVLTRGKNNTEDNIRYVHWDAKAMTGWEAELENADVLINLAGKSVDCRYNERNKNEILASRIDSTVILNKAVVQCAIPPKHWLNSSTSTIYRHSLDKQMDEETGEIGFDFSMNVAKMWERAFFQAETQNQKDGLAYLYRIRQKRRGLHTFKKAGAGGLWRKARQWKTVRELDT